MRLGPTQTFPRTLLAHPLLARKHGPNHSHSRLLSIVLSRWHDDAAGLRRLHASAHLHCPVRPIKVTSPSSTPSFLHPVPAHVPSASFRRSVEHRRHAGGNSLRPVKGNAGEGDGQGGQAVDRAGSRIA